MLDTSTPFGGRVAACRRAPRAGCSIAHPGVKKMGRGAFREPNARHLVGSGTGGHKRRQTEMCFRDVRVFRGQQPTAPVK